MTIDEVISAAVSDGEVSIAEILAAIPAELSEYVKDFHAKTRNARSVAFLVGTALLYQDPLNAVKIIDSGLKPMSLHAIYDEFGDFSGFYAEQIAAYGKREKHGIGHDESLLLSAFDNNHVPFGRSRRQQS